MKSAGFLNVSLLLQFLTSVAGLSLSDPTAGPVLTTPEIRHAGLSFTSWHYRAFAGSSVELTCVFFDDHDPACGTSPPTGTIEKLARRRPIKPTKSIYVEKIDDVREWTMRIDNVSRSDAGFYQCIVSCGEKMWRAVTKLSVDVQYKNPNTSWWRAENGSLTVSCAYSGFPKAVIGWLNSTGITTHNSTLYHRLWYLNSTMFVPNPDPKTSAYYCILISSGGDFDIGTVKIQTQTQNKISSGRSMGRRAAEEDDQEDSEGFTTVSLILILTVCFIMLGLLLKCLCNMWTCLCCCRIPMV